MMTFEEFQAKKVQLSLEAGINELGLSEEAFEDSNTTGFLSYDGFFIEITEFLPTKYYLLIENSDWVSDDLEDLERKLYDYAVSVNFWN